MFKPIENNKVHTLIMNQIKESIKNGELKLGDRLPSERILSDQLKVSRASIRETIRSMEMMGLVKCVQGEGNFIVSSLEESFIEPMSMMFMLSNSKLNEINEFRRALEIESVRLASKRISEDSLHKLNEMLEAIEESEDELYRVKADKAFHYEIAKISKNTFIINILNAAASLIENHIKDVRALIISNQKNTSDINLQHRAIVKALENRDEKSAIRAMSTHLSYVHSKMEDETVNMDINT